MAKAPTKPAGKAAPAAPEKPEESAPPKKSMGKLIGIAVLGMAIGGGGVAGYFRFLGPKPAAAHAEPVKTEEPEHEESDVPPETLKIERMVLPMLTHDGQLKGYMNLEIVIEIEKESGEFVKARLPMIRHGFNAALIKTCVLGADDARIDYDAASKVLTAAANESIGKPKILKVNIVTALPL